MIAALARCFKVDRMPAISTVQEPLQPFSCGFRSMSPADDLAHYFDLKSPDPFRDEVARVTTSLRSHRINPFGFAKGTLDADGEACDACAM
ncbi:hypothetical protein IVB16_31840 [Bradyrhizobium sp. 183]|uniref:hypothetical protein n=1 Tax=unclassified Bradyrhizobium TaxID=2631580 RepID=UPI001FFF75C5|nr:MULTISPECIES: hypothetical protein [unclassified Bradyrhizobium]UPJ79308.1 hypothetical protein IVB17_31840 [Bradyrhizobium sp. 184]UPJ87102.1 hypothetical protein IVB16_31840 [Bradyrhizobium sp. 183]